MTDPAARLAEYRPLLRYDSLESYRTDSVATITDHHGSGETNLLRRAGGEIVAASDPAAGHPVLSLEFLRAGTYPNGEPVRADDFIEEPGRDYVAQARAMHAAAGYADRVYGHVATDRHEETWLQYWFFSYYDDRALLGIGVHEADWEMIQLRLGPDGVPDEVTFAQHTSGERLTWSELETLPTEDGQAAPVVYVARGSHASYARVGTHQGPVIPDHNDGKGPLVRPVLEVIDERKGPGWVGWPGRFGSTKARLPGEVSSPPGPIAHLQWTDPAAFHEKAHSTREVHARARVVRAVTPPPAPLLSVRRDGDRAIIGYRLPPPPVGGEPAAKVLLSVDDPADAGPPATYSFDVTGSDGEEEHPLPLGGGAYIVRASAASADGHSSPVVEVDLDSVADGGAQAVARSPLTLVDLHAHYPMHLIPDGRRTHDALRAWRSARFRARLVALLSRLANYQGPEDTPSVTIDLLKEGRVAVALSVLYSPFDEMDLDRSYGSSPDPAYFGRLLDLLELVEQDIAAHQDARVARDRNELDRCLADHKIAVVHAVEGGFHLGADPDAIARNVAELARRGVAYVTLAHLFWRGVATNAPALPFLPDWLYRLIFPQPKRIGLTPLGEAAVRAMVQHRVLVDITHMSEQSITDTFALLDEIDPARSTAVIASHMACRLGSLAYNLTDDHIRQVAERGGLLGVIDCRHYATDGIGGRSKDGSPADSLDAIYAHIDRIAEVTASDDHAAIGTDLDGYIKPALTGFEHEGRMAALQDALDERYGTDRARKICSDNALRVLRASLDR